MKSWEVLRESTEKVGVKAVAARLKLSTALVYKWCQEPGSLEPGASGARNPLDRVAAIVATTGDITPLTWLCNAADGFFVPNPKANPGPAAEALLGTTQRVVHDFGGLLSDISRSIEDDGLIMPDEAERIRRSWEHLKMQAEAFVVACERGVYGEKRDTPET